MTGTPRKRIYTSSRGAHYPLAVAPDCCHPSRDSGAARGRNRFRDSSLEGRAVPCIPQPRLHLLQRPEHHVGLRLVDPKPFELGRDLSPVIARVVDHVPQRYPRRQP